MDKGTITKILSDFGPEDTDQPEPIGRGAPITVWVSSEDHNRYSRIQKMSKRKFSKSHRKIFLVALEEAEKKLGISEG